MRTKETKLVLISDSIQSIYVRLHKTTLKQVKNCVDSGFQRKPAWIANSLLAFNFCVIED